MKKYSRFFILVLVGLSSGCISLQPVGTLSEKSLKGLAIYEEIPVTYATFCAERCQFNLIRRNQLVRDSAIDCNCTLFSSADKATTKVYAALAAYFKSLGDLSEGKLTAIETKALSEALVEGKFASLTIDKNTVNAYSGLSRVLIQAFTDGYRKQKVKQVIESANPHIQTLTRLFQTSMSNLSMELDFQKERNFALYSELINEKMIGYDKLRLSSDYYAQINMIREKQAQLELFSNGLTLIAEGHQKLYDTRSKMSAKQLNEMLAGYSASLQDIIIAFKKL